MYFSMRRRSKIEPDTGETTGCSGTSLETEKNNKMLIVYQFNRVRCLNDNQSKYHVWIN